MLRPEKVSVNKCMKAQNKYPDILLISFYFQIYNSKSDFSHADFPMFDQQCAFSADSWNYAKYQKLTLRIPTTIVVSRNCFSDSSKIT